MGNGNLKELRKDFWDALRKQFRESGTLLEPGGTKDGFWLLFKLGVRDNKQPTQQNIAIVWDDDGESFHFVVMFYGQPKYPLTSGKYYPGYSREWYCFFKEKLHLINGQLRHKVDWVNHMPIEIGLRTKDFDAQIWRRDSWPHYIEEMKNVVQGLHDAFDWSASTFELHHLRR